MTQPAKRTQTDQIGRHIKRQVWILFILIVIVTILDLVGIHSQLVVAKSMAIGGLLSVVTQSIFALFVFRHTGYRARLHIVSQLYRGQMFKWLLTALGFAIIFITIQPLSALSLFLGFIVMQITQSVMLLHLH